MHYKDTRHKYKLISWIRHPFLIYEAWSRRNRPVVDLDDEDNNCEWCGYDHHWHERLNNPDQLASRHRTATRKAITSDDGARDDTRKRNQGGVG